MWTFYLLSLVGFHGNMTSALPTVPVAFLFFMIVMSLFRFVHLFYLHNYVNRLKNHTNEAEQGAAANP